MLQSLGFVDQIEKTCLSACASKLFTSQTTAKTILSCYRILELSINRYKLDTGGIRPAFQKSLIFLMSREKGPNDYDHHDNVGNGPMLGSVFTWFWQTLWDVVLDFLLFNENTM